jgi:hypothetical protein
LYRTSARAQLKRLVHAAAVVAAVASILAPPAPRRAHAESAVPRDPATALTEFPASTGGVTLSDLRGRYNQVLAQGLVRLRASRGGDDHIVGDSTDSAGMHWTKCTNLGLDLVGTLVAEARGFMTAAETREHVRRILEILRGLRTYHGIFPEIIQLDDGVRPEVKAGRIRYSSVDSAWVTVALTLVEARYDAVPDAGDESASAELATRARALVAGQDYGVFLGSDGLLGGGFWVDARTYQIVESLGFSYGDRASEARPLILALVGLGKVAPSAFDNMRTSWAVKEGLAVMEGWRWSAFVEMTGELWLDEMALAPLSLGRSHANYLEATTRVARRLGHAVWGYAPACDVERGYSEYGLDRAELVSPYAGGLLAMTGDPRAVANLERILVGLAGDASDGRPLPEGLDPKTGRVACGVARTLDQSLLFLSLNADVVRALARRTAWYASAEQRTRELDRTSQPPALLRAAAPPATLGLAPNSSARAGAAALNPIPPIPPIPPGAPTSPILPGGPGGPGEGHPEPGAEELDSPGPGAAGGWGPVPDATGLKGLLAAIRRSESEAGGSTDLARSQLHLASATTARAWADFSPELALAIRHPFGNSLTDPTWRGIAQARVALSFDKLWTALAAGDAEGGARAALGQHERQGWRRGLEGYLALYLAERRVRALGDHRASLAGFASGLSGGEQKGQNGVAGSLDDLVLLRARLSALDAALTDARATQQLALERLRALSGASTITASGLDPRLDPGQVLGLIGEATLDPAAVDAEVDEERATAELEQQKSLLARADSRAPYVPELRAGAFVDVPRVDSATGTGATEKIWAVDRVTGALSLAFDVRPGSGPEREAGASAVARSLHRLDQIRQERAARVARARARLRARLSIWSAHPEAVAGALYRDAGGRLQRGEVAVGTLLAASHGLVDSEELAERTFGEAVAAGVALAAEGVRPLSDLAGGPAGGAAPTGGVHPAALSTSDASAAGQAAVLAAPAVRAADAEADRARAEAVRAQRDSWHIGLEAGVAYPLHTRAGAIVDQSIGSPMGLGQVALATERIREPTLLGRLALELKGNREAAQAAEAEAELRAVQSELAHKRRLAEQAGARLDLAFARSLTRAAASHASFCTDQLRLAQQMQSEGLTDDPGTVRQAELRAKAARARWVDAREALQQAALRTSQLLGRPTEVPLAIAETPEEIVAWLREKHYPEAGLLGFRAALGAKVAELEQRRAQADLRALRNPPSAVDLTVQATEQLRGYGHAVGLALGLRLDPVKNPAKILEAARIAGEKQGGIRGEAEELEAERRVAHAELEAAARAQALAEESRRRLVEVLEDLKGNQAMRPELHASLKARSRGAVEAELQEIDLGVIETRARLARAELAALELDPPGAAPAAPAAPDRSPVGTGTGTAAASPGAIAVGAAIDPADRTLDRTFERTIDQLVASDPELDAAAGASRAVALERANGAPGLLAGLHLAGPIVGASYGIGRSPTGAVGAVGGPTMTTRDADAFASAGLSYDVAEGFAFLGTRRQARASVWAATAAHERAESRALAQLGRLWNARAEVRAAEDAAAEHRRRLEDLAVPRYHAAQISAEALAAASVSASSAAAALRAAEGVERKERAALAQRGVTVSDQLLDEIGRRTAPESVPAAAAGLATWEQSALRTGPDLTALREREEAARDEAGLGYARLFGTTTLLLEVDPQRRGTTLDLPDAPTATERQLAWVSSLFVPLRLGALGEGGEAGALAEVRRAEVRAAERALRSSFAETRLRLVLAADAWRASERARLDAGLAFAEVDRRYRGALGGANADTHAEAADDVSAAEARARAARAELTDLLAPIQRRIR